MGRAPSKRDKSRGASTRVSRQVRPTGRMRKGIRNADRRVREYLTHEEIRFLRTAAKETGRHGFRDSTVIMCIYLHGLRISELCDLRWADIDLRRAKVHVRRVKGSSDSVQDINGVELRALRRLKRDYQASAWVFTTERGTPLSGSTIQKLIRRAGDKAGLTKRVGPLHPHMLRHSTGYALANRGVDTRTIQGYLGHRSISHTVRYTELSTERFTGLLPRL